MFEKRLQLLEVWDREPGDGSVEDDSGGNVLEFDIDEALPGSLEYGYKGRSMVEGCLLHYAIERDSRLQSGTASSITELVLRAGARADAWAMYYAEAKEARFLPVHLAAGLGATGALRLLVQLRADVDQKTTRGDVPHYTALHDASFAQQPDAARALLELRANPDIRNLHGQTPIHIVAKNGNVEIAKLLVQHKARLDMAAYPKEEPVGRAIASLSSFRRFTARWAFAASRAGRGQDALTPLRIAISGNRQFPLEELHILAPFFGPDCSEKFLPAIAKICQINLPAAKSLVRSFKMHNKQDPSDLTMLKNQLLQEENTIEQITTLMRYAPEVALEIFEMLCVKPLATHPDYHPLPVLAGVSGAVSIFNFALRKSSKHPLSANTTYVQETKWSFSPEVDHEHLEPEWHRRLAPPPRGGLSDFEVELRLLLFPNIVDTRVIHSINCLRLGDEKMYAKYFTKLVIQAIVNCAWDHVRNAVYFGIVVDLLVLGILTMWVFNQSDYGADTPQNFVCWSVLGGCAAREVLDNISVMYRHLSWGFALREFFSWSRVFRIVLPVMLIMHFIWCDSPERLDVEAPLFSLNLLLRWCEILHMLKMITGLGDKMIAYANSVFPMSDFFVFAGLVYLAFFSAFGSIRGDLSLSEVNRLLFYSVFTNDGDSFVTLQSLDRQGPMTFALLGTAIIVFSLAILNLMISISSSMYGDYEEQSLILFLQNRCMAVENFVQTLGWDCRGGPGGGRVAAAGTRYWLGPRLFSASCFAMWYAAAARPQGRLRLFVAMAAFGLGLVVLQASLMDARTIDLDSKRRSRRVVPPQRRTSSQARCPSTCYLLVEESEEAADDGAPTTDIGAESDCDDSSLASSGGRGGGGGGGADAPHFLWVCKRKPDMPSAPAWEEEKGLALQVKALRDTLDLYGTKMAELCASVNKLQQRQAEDPGQRPSLRTVRTAGTTA